MVYLILDHYLASLHLDRMVEMNDDDDRMVEMNDDNKLSEKFKLGYWRINFCECGMVICRPLIL